MKILTIFSLVLWCLGTALCFSQEEPADEDESEEVEDTSIMEEEAPAQKDQLKEVAEPLEEKKPQPSPESEAPKEKPTMEKLTSIKTEMPYRGKSEVGAFFLSFLIGFGTGNFYIENMQPAYIALLGQIVGVGVLGAGFGMLAMDPDLEYDLFDNEVLVQEYAVYAGIGIFAGMRLFDIVSATVGAHQYNEANKHKFMGQERLRIQPVVLASQTNHVLGFQIQF